MVSKGDASDKLGKVEGIKYLETSCKRREGLIVMEIGNTQVVVTD